MVEQGYLEIDTARQQEVRIRRKGDEQNGFKYFETEKIGSGEVRTEIESQISQEEFESQWPQTEGKRVLKTRYEIPHFDSIGQYDGLIELDVYDGSLTSLVTAEIEFPSKDAADKFIPPDWFGESVTENLAYKNQHLAVEGLPKKDASNV